MMPALESVIRPGEGILVGQACAEPQSLLEALVERRDALKGCRLFLGIHYSGILRPEHADCLRFTAYCGIGKNRALADAGVLDILPVPYSMLGPLIRSGKIPADVVLLQVSPACVLTDPHCSPFPRQRWRVPDRRGSSRSVLSSGSVEDRATDPWSSESVRSSSRS